jgi:hypothetical protein
MNTALRNFQINMVNLINSAQLPTEAKRLVVSEILHKLEVQVEKDIMLEAQQTEEKESEEE